MTPDQLQLLGIISLLPDEQKQLINVTKNKLAEVVAEAETNSEGCGAIAYALLGLEMGGNAS